jgi:hypothetical protein
LDSWVVGEVNTAHLELALGEYENALDLNGHGLLDIRSTLVFHLRLQELGAAE